MIKPYAEDLIFSSACLASKLSREQDYEKCLDYVYEYKDTLPNFYLEMQSHYAEQQEEFNKRFYNYQLILILRLSSQMMHMLVQKNS